jgi:hypothetical protein
MSICDFKIFFGGYTLGPPLTGERKREGRKKGRRKRGTDGKEKGRR